MTIPVLTVKKADLKNFKKSLKDPVTLSHIDNVLKGEETTEENAKAACLSFLAKFPGTDVKSLCCAMGYEGLETEIQSILEQRIEQDILQPVEASKEKLPLLEVQEGEEEPAPISGSTIAERFKSQYSFRQRQSSTRYGATDAKLASVAYVLFGDDSCIRIQETRVWYRWLGHKWAECDEGHIRQHLDEVAVLIEQDMKATKKRYQQTRNGGDFEVLSVIKGRYGLGDNVTNDSLRQLLENEMDKMQSMVSRLESLAGRNAVIELMGDRLVKSLDLLDVNRDEVVFTNVAWNAKTQAFYPPRRASLATKSTERPWAAPSEAARARWQEYLNGLGFDDDTLRFLKRSFGYTLLGRGTAKRYWWFRGETHTSKTTTVQLVAKCLGTYVESTQTKMWLSKGSAASGHTDEIARLRGCRMVTADEFPKVGKMDDALTKQITSGGSPMSASRKGEKGFTFAIQFAPFFSSNFDPYIAEDDTAMINRLTALTFKKKVDKIDQEFVNNYLSDGDNPSAILQWCMEGAVEFIAEGFGEEPQEIRASREEYQKEQGSIVEQLSGILELAPSKKAFFQDIRVALVDYQKSSRQVIYFSDKQLSSAIQDAFKVKSMRGTNGKRVFMGISLIAPKQKKSYDSRIDYGPEPDEYEDLSVPN